MGDETSNSDQDLFTRLLGQAEPRDQPSPDARRQAFNELHGEWSAMTAGRRRRRWTGGFAIAASVAAAVLALWMFLQPAPRVEAELAATVAEVTGTELMRNGRIVEDLAELTLDAGDTLTLGENSRVRLSTPSGADLRLDEGTAVVFLEAGRVRLGRGKVYFDSAGLSHGSPFELATPWGGVTHLGTQYMAQVSEDSLEVSVREGAIRLGGSGDSDPVRSGERIRVDEEGEHIDSVARHGAAWDWVLALAPRRSPTTVGEALAWIARETGYGVRFESPTAESAVAQEEWDFPGNLKPEEALDALLTPLSMRSGAVTLDGDQLVVSEVEQ